MTAFAVAAYHFPLARQQLSAAQRTGLLPCAAAMVTVGGPAPTAQNPVGFPHPASQGLRYGLATPLLALQPPSTSILTAAFVVAGTTLLNGSGHLHATAFACALTIALVIGMFVALAAAIAFLGLILTGASLVLWFTGLRDTGASRAAISIGIIPVAALAVASIHTSTLPASARIAAVAMIAAGFMLATTAWTRHLPAIPVRLRPAICSLALLALAAGCRTPTLAPALEDPAQPVRAYFAALARGDTATAYQLSRSASRWLTGDGLAHGYQPPTGLTIISTTLAPTGHGNVAYIRAQYQLAGAPFESTLEVWKTPTEPPYSLAGRWAITSGATGRLDVISPRTPHVKIANVEVTTPLSGPRISGGTPSAGYFEVPPGVYTITTITLATDPPQPTDEVDIAVPAMWRDGTPATATIHAPPEARQPTR